MKGRKAKPTALKLLQGNPGKRKLDTLHEPQPVIGLGLPPPELAGDDDAIRVWMELGPELVTMGTLGESDRNLFAAYCQAVSENRILSGQIMALRAKRRRSGKDELAMITAIAQRRKARAELAKYGAEFGIGASSRTKIKLKRDDGQLPLAGLGEPESPLARILGRERSA